MNHIPFMPVIEAHRPFVSNLYAVRCSALARMPPVSGIFRHQSMAPRFNEDS
jgi:hypothetical protein